MKRYFFYCLRHNRNIETPANRKKNRSGTECSEYGARVSALFGNRYRASVVAFVLSKIEFYGRPFYCTFFCTIFMNICFLARNSVDRCPEVRGSTAMRISWGDGEGNSEMQTGTAHESGGAATAHRTQLSVVDESKRDMVNGIRHQENSRSLRSIGTRERQSIGGSDMTVNSFFTADEDESGGDRQKTTVIKSGGQRLTSCRYEVRNCIF